MEKWTSSITFHSLTKQQRKPTHYVQLNTAQSKTITNATRTTTATSTCRTDLTHLPRFMVIHKERETIVYSHTRSIMQRNCTHRLRLCTVHRNANICHWIEFYIHYVKHSGTTSNTANANVDYHNTRAPFHGCMTYHRFSFIDKTENLEICSLVTWKIVSICPQQVSLLFTNILDRDCTSSNALHTLHDIAQSIGIILNQLYYTLHTQTIHSAYFTWRLHSRGKDISSARDVISFVSRA